jgi:hypothetical protein
MAMLQERIASETFVRSQLADLEDKVQRLASCVSICTFVLVKQVH